MTFEVRRRQLTNRRQGEAATRIHTQHQLVKRHTTWTEKQARKIITAQERDSPMSHRNQHNSCLLTGSQALTLEFEVDSRSALVKESECWLAEQGEADRTRFLSARHLMIE